MAEVQQAFPIQLRQFVESKQTDLASTLPKQIDPERFLRVALLAVTKNKALWECSKESVFLAIMESARVGLQIDNKEAALIPYGGHAEFMPMVTGIIRLMLRSPGLTKVEARVVREGDEFEYRYGLDPQLEHKPVGGSDREITHAYAVMWRQGAGTTFEIVTREEIEQVRGSSRAPDSPAWKNWYGEMCRKVVLKRLAKYADLSPEATRAIELDHIVTGSEPWGVEYVEGPSEEFRNQLVKNQTEAGIAQLKQRMAGAGDEPQRHPPLETEMEQAPPTEPETDGVVEAPDAELDVPAKKPAVKKATKLSEDWTTMFWGLATRYQLDKEQAAEVLRNHDNNFHHAYEALKASLEPEPPQ
jgi:recombination protein RecT